MPERDANQPACSGGRVMARWKEALFGPSLRLLRRWFPAYFREGE